MMNQPMTSQPTIICKIFDHQAETRRERRRKVTLLSNGKIRIEGITLRPGALEGQERHFVYYASDKVAFSIMEVDWQRLLAKASARERKSIELQEEDCNESV